MEVEEVPVIMYSVKGVFTVFLNSDRGVSNLCQLFLRDVPQHLNNIMDISSHFQKFGDIVNVQVHADKDQAYVQFKTHEQADNALNSEEAVCGNRFIKIFWAHYDRQVG